MFQKLNESEILIQNLGSRKLYGIIRNVKKNPLDLFSNESAIKFTYIHTCMYYLNIRNITEINSIVCSDMESLKVISFKEKQIIKKRNYSTPGDDIR